MIRNLAPAVVYIVLMALATVLVAVACGAPAGPGDRGNVRRVRFEEDRVTCYLYSGVSISCLRDQP